MEGVFMSHFLIPAESEIYTRSHVMKLIISFVYGGISLSPSINASVIVGYSQAETIV